MKPDTRHEMTSSGRKRLLTRYIGLTAILVAVIGLIMFLSMPGAFGPGKVFSVALLIVGLGVGAYALVTEITSASASGSAHKGQAGINAGVQVALAVGLVILINLYSFLHHTEFDLTRDSQFTLPKSTIVELQKLKSETTIVVLQQHKTFGRLSDKPDRYDYAAERKVVEKVQDIVDLFRKFGPQFKVVVLDVEEESYDKKFEELTKEDPTLRTAIQTAPENSIFFASEGKVQRMSFNEFYQLDREASKEGRGNLVLQPQGIATLVKRITAIEEKKPRIAVAVPHEWLTTQVTEGQEQYTLAGLRKSLTNYGFDVVDVVIKKFPGAQPASFTYEETKLNRLEDEYDTARQAVSRSRKVDGQLARLRQLIEDVKDKPLLDRVDNLEKIYDAISPDDANLTEAQKKDPNLMVSFESAVMRRFASVERQLAADKLEAQDEMSAAELGLKDIQRNDRSLEDRYLSDVKYKFQRLLSQCDLLIIPRMTIINPTMPENVLPMTLHRFDKEQAEVVKEFMKSGKPVLVCAGPVNTPQEGAPLPEVADDIEQLLVDRGVVLAKQTILFNVEAKAFRDPESGDRLGSSAVQLPPLLFQPPDDWKSEGTQPNPISQALQLLVKSIGHPLDIEVRAPRPITLKQDAQRKQSIAASFLWTSPKSWNETFPFNSRIRFIPQMGPVRQPLPPPQKDTEDEALKTGRPSVERDGPFSIAVAIDAAMPKAWYKDDEWKKIEPLEEKKRPTSRLVVVGHGGIFNKKELSPASEQLLLTISNWLLNRDERLPHQADPKAPNAVDRPWSYGRVEMSETSKNLWHWGTFIGLPAIFIYTGLIVLMVRRVR